MFSDSLNLPTVWIFTSENSWLDKHNVEHVSKIFSKHLISIFRKPGNPQSRSSFSLLYLWLNLICSDLITHNSTKKETFSWFNKNQIFVLLITVLLKLFDLDNKTSLVGSTFVYRIKSFVGYIATNILLS